MNLTTRAQSKLRTSRVDKSATPTSQDSSPRPHSTKRKKSSEIDTKAKRTRTGCLTCRERHLKCDEALGRCLNCWKSNRICRRGVRLNFIDIQTVAPPHLIARPHGAAVTFLDDSRFIASKYVGGFERYPPLQPDSPVQERRLIQHEALHDLGPEHLASLFQSVAHSFDPAGFEFSNSVVNDFLLGPDAWHEPHLAPGDELLPHGTSNFARKLAMKQYSLSSLTDSDQIIFLQTFTEEVGPWMDSLDTVRHFAHILPLYALDEPMLLNAFLACGARHLSTVNSSFTDEKTTQYYDAAVQELMSAMQDPDRDSVLCATAALVLGAYETISHMRVETSHLAGSRALIRECGWTSKTPGLGGVSFWMSINLELLGCLKNTWSLSWDPDAWGVDLDMDHAQPFWKGDDIWLHRVLYICAKALNFRVSMQHLQTANGSTAQPAQLNEALQKWNHCNSLCEQWSKAIPRSMKPLGRVEPWQTNLTSVFPKIWLTKRSAIVAQLFYHVAHILLARAHPMRFDYDMEMKEMQNSHAHEICGLVASSKDRSVASISIHCLALAAESLEDQKIQSEALGIIDTIAKDTPWHVDPVKEDLKRTWGWSIPHPETVDPTQMHNQFYDLDPILHPSKQPGFSGTMVNPFLSAGDFSLENHPYQGYYVPPHHVLDHYPHESYLV